MNSDASRAEEGENNAAIPAPQAPPQKPDALTTSQEHQPSPAEQPPEVAPDEQAASRSPANTTSSDEPAPTTSTIPSMPATPETLPSLLGSSVLQGLPASISSPLLYLHQRMSNPLPKARRRNNRVRLIGGIIVILLAITLLSPVAFAFAHAHLTLKNERPQPQNPQTVDGPLAWSLDQLQTAPNLADAGFARHNDALDPLFRPYYLRHAGALWLGTPLTSAFITHQGIVQFFTGGALLAPGQYALDGHTKTSQPPATDATAPNDLSHLIIDDGVYDQTTGVEWLPLLHTLLSVGSEVPLLATGNTNVTYAWLRAATSPNALVAKRAGSLVTPSVWVYATLGAGPGTPVSVSDSPTSVSDPTPATPRRPVSKSVFVVEGNSNGVPVGHYIPPQIWNALLQPTIAPDGWQTDVGAPLSEALAMTMTAPDGTQHHLLVQAFWEGVLTYDLDAPTPEQAIAPLALGRAYLLTLGAPTAYAPTGMRAWGISANPSPITTQLLHGKLEVHLGLNAQVTLTGAAQWQGDALYYGVRWATYSQHGHGWALASAFSLHPPLASSPRWEGVDALSPSVARYLTTLGNDAGVAVFDLTRNTYYVSNDQQVFIMASSAKVPLLVAYLAMLESEGAAPQDSDIATLSAMIEVSDNNAAQLVYQTIGYDAGLDAYLQSIGINDYVRNPDGWGYGEWSPLSMVRLLTMLQDGQLLNADDTNLALSLMSNVEPDEQEGVGDTAPTGANYAMKDGWVQGPDGLWDVNSSGIVILGSEMYIISVYSADQDSLESGWSITQQVCGPIGQLLA